MIGSIKIARRHYTNTNLHLFFQVIQTVYTDSVYTDHPHFSKNKIEICTKNQSRYKLATMTLFYKIIMHCSKNLYVVVISSHNFGISSDGGVTEMGGL